MLRSNLPPIGFLHYTETVYYGEGICEAPLFIISRSAAWLRKPNIPTKSAENPMDFSSISSVDRSVSGPLPVSAFRCSCAVVPYCRMV